LDSRVLRDQYLNERRKQRTGVMGVAGQAPAAANWEGLRVLPHNAMEYDFGWCWTGTAGWDRVAPQGCPGRTASGVLRVR